MKGEVLPCRLITFSVLRLGGNSLNVFAIDFLICFAIVAARSTMRGRALELQLWAAQSEFSVANVEIEQGGQRP